MCPLCRRIDRPTAAISWYPAAPPGGTGTALPRAWSSCLHVLRPGFHLVAHRRFRGAAVRRGLYRAVLLEVVAMVAAEADPVAAVGGKALVAFPEVLQVVGIDQRCRRVDQVVIGERAAVDRLRGAPVAGMADLGGRGGGAGRAHGAAPVQRRLHPQPRGGQGTKGVYPEGILV